jgi:hypothetical protein
MTMKWLVTDPISYIGPLFGLSIYTVENMDSSKMWANKTWDWRQSLLHQWMGNIRSDEAYERIAGIKIHEEPQKDKA